MTDPISLFVVDDHSLFREGLLRLLAADQSLRVVGGADSMEQALRTLPSTGVDVLIVDYDLGDENAVALVRRLRDRDYPARILLVTAGLPNHDALEIIVLDEGLGLADDANLFVPFFTTKPEGSGIGLALSRQIAEAHGGALALQNRTDRAGCRAELRLPLLTA